MTRVRLERSNDGRDLFASFKVTTSSGERSQKVELQLRGEYVELDKAVMFGTVFNPEREQSGLLTFRTLENNAVVGNTGIRIVSMQDSGFYVPFNDIAWIEVAEDHLLKEDLFGSSFLFKADTHFEAPCVLPFFHIRALMEFAYSDVDTFRHFHHRPTVVQNRHTGRMHFIQLSKTEVKEVYWKTEDHLPAVYETEHVVIYDLDPYPSKSTDTGDCISYIRPASLFLTDL